MVWWSNQRYTFNNSNFFVNTKVIKLFCSPSFVFLIFKCSLALVLFSTFIKNCFTLLFSIRIRYHLNILDYWFSPTPSIWFHLHLNVLHLCILCLVGKLRGFGNKIYTYLTPLSMRKYSLSPYSVIIVASYLENVTHQVSRHTHFFQNSPYLFMIQTVKAFAVIYKAETHFLLKFFGIWVQPEHQAFLAPYMVKVFVTTSWESLCLHEKLM